MQAPDAKNALSTMPGAEKASTGRGPEAFHSTLLGEIVSIGVFILLLPFLYIFLGRIYTSIEPLMACIVGFFFLFLIFREENLPAIYTSILAGALGILTLNNNLGGSFILMPVFSGLFAIPAVATSLQENYTLPEQETESSFKGIKGSLTGLLSDLIAGIVPGAGAAASTSVLSPIMDRESDFLAGVGGVNTTNMITSLLVLLAIGNARSGASVALQSLMKPKPKEIFILIGISIFCAGISALLALRTERVFLRFIGQINFRRAGIAILVVIVALSGVSSGFFGILALATGSLVGYYSLINGCRGCCMAVLLVPALSFFI